MGKFQEVLASLPKEIEQVKQQMDGLHEEMTGMKKRLDDEEERKRENHEPRPGVQTGADAHGHSSGKEMDSEPS